jgi:hypothetical protein
MEEAGHSLGTIRFTGSFSSKPGKDRQAFPKVERNPGFIGVYKSKVLESTFCAYSWIRNIKKSQRKGKRSSLNGKPSLWLGGF